jgi:bifunctional DNA-binding transcriptional regulator/antitoxin component of YhaV-PrlF toxin-antitoxin module
MAKVYRSNNKLIIAIPNDVVSALGIKEGDDLDFFEYVNSTYILAKKNDIVKLLAGSREVQAQTQGTGKAVQEFKVQFSKEAQSISQAELAVLKKLDTMRYNDRTASKVNSVLNSSEKEILQLLIKRKIVSPFKKEGEKEMKYSIGKEVYDNFLYRKGKTAQPASAAPSPVKAKASSFKPQASVQTASRAWEQRLDNNAYTDMLEAKGYLVLSNEADAAMVSSALEESIRHGLILGTRAFNKKFYIGLRGYINKNASKILKLIDQKSMGISEIAEETGIEEDGIRTILYVLSESGDVTEVRRDIFRVA